MESFDMQIVYLQVNPKSQKKGQRGSLCETVLGLVPGHFIPGDPRVMVAGIVPGGVALQSQGKLQVGDWIISLNDLDVTHENIDSLLNAISRPRQVKLAIKSLNKREDNQWVSNSQQLPQKFGTLHTNINTDSAVRSNNNKTLMENNDGNLHVMYLTTETPTENIYTTKDDDLIYKFPKNGDISDLRGLFETLPQLLFDVTDDYIKGSTLKINNETFYVSYINSQPEILVFAAPAKVCSLKYLIDLMKDLSRLWLVLYGSLQSAFKSQSNHGEMDDFLTLVKHDVLSLNKNRAEWKAGNGVKCLPVNDSLRATISSTLSNYESAPIDELADDHYDIRRQYTIVGTTLFYKDQLVGSHLPKDDLYDINLFVYYTKLLHLSAAQEATGNLVTWREVFPTRRYHDPTSEAPVLGYSEPVDARWFILVIGIKKMLLIAILEAGGCAQWAEGETVSPNIFYIDQARSCLLQLDSLDIPGCCELALKQYSALFPSKKITDKSSPAALSLNSHLKHFHSLSSFKNDGDSLSVESSGSDIRRTSSITSLDSAESSTSSERIKTKSRFLPSAEQLSKRNSIASDILIRPLNIPKTKTPTSNLFFYMCCKDIEGVIIEPADTYKSESLQNDLFQENLLENFYTAAISIRTSFKKYMAKADSNKENTRFFINQQNTYEEGVLFHFTPFGSDKEKLKTVTYWVIGRLFLQPELKHLYVCHPDGITPSLVEIAFLNCGSEL